MSLCTILIPTHRHQYLSRSIRYFQQFDFPIVYCDSSDQAWSERLPGNIQYLHCPKLNFAQKILFALQKIGTPYVTLCADDDFLNENALHEGLSQLEMKPRLTAAVGRTLAFDDIEPDKFYQIGSNAPWPEVEGECEDNLKNYMSNYHQILWSLFRKDILQTAMNMVDKAKFENDNFIELVISTLCAGNGGIAMLDDWWEAREITTLQQHWGQRNRTISFEYLADSTSKEDVSRFLEIIDAELGVGCGRLVLGAYAKEAPKGGASFVRKLISPFIPVCLKRSRLARKRFYVDEKWLRNIRKVYV